MSSSSIITCSRLGKWLCKHNEYFYFQGLALLIAIILRAMVSTRRSEFEEDDFENARGRTWEPLLNQTAQTSGSGTHADIWSSRMREKVLSI